MSLGGRLLSSLFGGNTGGVANALSSYAGVKSSTASTLMNLAAPLVLAVLGKRVRSDGLNASSLASLLHSQKDTYAAAVPGQLANIRDYVSAESRDREYYVPPTATTATARRASPWRWVIPALIALAVLWLLFSMLGRDRGVTETASVPATTAPATTPPAAVATAPPVAATAPTANVYFDVDQSSMPAGASTALASVIGYLNANPASTAVISGYHDPTGDRATNEALARDRAGAVRSALVAAGIPESRIELERPMETTGGGTMQDARRVEVKVR
jgi:outer membrane protein OmpA-like peptidoglycan-associated protein